jgi:hypothetical protein
LKINLVMDSWGHVTVGTLPKRQQLSNLRGLHVNRMHRPTRGVSDARIAPPNLYAINLPE